MINLNQSQIFYDPFPHIVLQNVFEEKFYKTLCDELGANLYTLQDDILLLEHPPKNEVPILARDYHLNVNQQHQIFEKFKYIFDNKLKPSSRPYSYFFI